MKYLLIILFTLGTLKTMHAQRDQMISQYMFNGLFLNPAYSGSHDYISTSLLYRTQWVDVKGAPQTYIASLDAPIKSNKMGVGLQLGHDVIGLTSQTDVYANYAYYLKFRASRLAFGIKAGVSQYGIDRNKLHIWDVEDPKYAGSSPIWIPKFGTGIYYYGYRFYLGVSVPTLLAHESDTEFGLDLNRTTQLNRHYYFNGGYVINLNRNIMLKPSFLIKYVPNTPVQADLNVNFLFNKVFWIGMSYRTGDSFISLLEYQINNRFRVGYSYDFIVSKLGNYSSGSHEIMLGIDFGKKALSSKSPRFF